MSLKTSKK